MMQPSQEEVSKQSALKRNDRLNVIKKERQRRNESKRLTSLLVTQDLHNRLSKRSSAGEFNHSMLLR